MRIGGFLKFSLIDYPGKISAVIFTQGCNFRCIYCHNPELVYPRLFSPPVPFNQIFSFLKKRQGVLEGVVISGGEPTLQDDLLDLILKIKSLGYRVKLDTNGSNPDNLAKVLPYIDYVTMDIKAPLFKDAYRRIAGVYIDEDKIIRSIGLIRASGIPYECRTTFDEQFLSQKDLKDICKMVFSKEKHVIQKANLLNKVLKLKRNKTG